MASQETKDSLANKVHKVHKDPKETVETKVCCGLSFLEIWEYHMCSGANKIFNYLKLLKKLETSLS